MSEAQFKRALEIINSFPKDGPVQPNYDEKLVMYQYFKQATIGDINIERPGFMNFEGKFKWDGWNSVKGTPKEVCYEKYVELFIKLLKASGHPKAQEYLDELEALKPVSPDPKNELEAPKPVSPDAKDELEAPKPVSPDPKDELEAPKPVSPDLETELSRVA